MLNNFTKKNLLHSTLIKVLALMMFLFFVWLILFKASPNESYETGNHEEVPGSFQLNDRLDIRKVKEKDWHEVFNFLKSDISGRDMVIAELPRLKTLNPSDPALLESLRHWVAGSIDDDQTRKLDCGGDIICQQLFLAADSGSVLRGFQQDILAAMCGFTSTTFGKLLNEFNFRVIYLSIGDPTGSTNHYVPLVEMNRNGEKIWSVQDPYYDTSFTSKDGKLLDYFEILKLLREGRHNEIIPTNPMGVERDVYKTVSNQENIIKTRWRDGIFRFFDDNSVKKHVSDMGCPDKSLYLYLFPFAFWGVSDNEANFLLSKAHKIVGDAPCQSAILS